MKISQISNFNQFQKQLNLQSLKGLWGKEDHNSESDSEGLDSWSKTTKHYYPFADETESNIEKIIKENTQPEEYNFYSADVPEWGGCYSETIVKRESRLPIKISEWLQFVKNKFSMKHNDRIFIEQTIKRLGLKV